MLKETCKIRYFLTKKEKHLNTRRRHLLGNAIQISEEILPHVHEAFHFCLDALQIKGYKGNLFIQQGATYNANVLSIGNQFDIVINSSLVDDFTIDELKFIFGHELGHVLLEHCQISPQKLIEDIDDITIQQVLLIFQWSRASEISADRIGLLCCGSLETAVRTLFKISSGIKKFSIDSVLRTFERQYKELENHIESFGGTHGWANTHPLVAIRFKAMQLASLDLTYLRSNPDKFSWLSFRNLDDEISRILISLDTHKSPTRGFHSDMGKLFIVQVLLYVSLSSGTVSWEHRWFIHDIVSALNSNLPVTRMIDQATSDVQTFVSSTEQELRANKNIFSQNELNKLFKLCYILIMRTPEHKVKMIDSCVRLSQVFECTNFEMSLFENTRLDIKEALT